MGRHIGVPRYLLLCVLRSLPISPVGISAFSIDANYDNFNNYDNYVYLCLLDDVDDKRMAC